MKKYFALPTLFLLVTVTFQSLQAQQKPAIKPADYGKWESLGYQTQISPDGEWLAIPIHRVNEKDELRIINMDEETKIVVPYGSDAAFSANSKWLAYSIGVSPKKQKQLEKKGESVKRKAGIFNLSSRDTTYFAAISSFQFSSDGRYAALFGYADSNGGADLLVYEPATDKAMHFGNVTEYSWSDNGSVLAFIVQTETGKSNGIQLYTPAAGKIRVLDSSDKHYTGIAWRKDAPDLAVLRAVKDSTYKDKTHIVLAWRNAGSQDPERFELHPSKFEFLSDKLNINEHYSPEWSEDGSQIYIGLRPRIKAESKPEFEVNTPEDVNRSDVQIWHVDDYRIYPYQESRAEQYLSRTLRAVWHIDENRVVKIGSDLTDEVNILEGGRFAVETDHNPYMRPNMFGRRWVDVYLIDTETGERQKIIGKVRYFMGGSSAGRYLLWFDGQNYWTYDTQTGNKTNITEGLNAPFEDQDDDYPGAIEPPNGIAGWSQNDEAVFVYSEYDMWRIAPDGSDAVQLTHGAQDSITYRFVQLNQEDDSIDLNESVYLSMTGEWTKKEGFARLNTDGSVSPLIYKDASLGRLVRADSAAVFAFIGQNYDDSPDVFITGPDFDNPQQVTETNPFQAEYAWGRSRLINYKSAAGIQLQGALFYPANYDSSRKYPMIVYQYEKLSQRVHNYITPALTNYYNATVWSGKGYFVLMPDIVYSDGEPGQSAVDAIVPAVKKVIETGLVDPDKIGLIGHSFGGYQATFIPTQTDIFAAAVEGAGITNMLSFPGQIHWNSGSPEFGHLETGQFRMAKPPWEASEDYLQNSPIHFIEQLNTPLLMEAGNEDGTVDWHQALQFYNFARRAEVENLVLLVYPGENHGLSEEANQIDYHKRILQWFGHWLKGEPAKGWMKEGVSYLKRKRGLEGAEDL